MRESPLRQMGKQLKMGESLSLTSEDSPQDPAPPPYREQSNPVGLLWRMSLHGQGPGEPPASPVPLCPAEEGWPYLDGKARGLLGTAGVTVHPTTEGDSSWGVGTEIQVVVNKLAPLHEHEGSLLVHPELLGGEADDVV